MKNKGKINLIIDIIMFFLMMMIAGIGFMIKYVLVSGYKRNTIFKADVDLLFLGLDRHQWGTIHLILGFLLLFLLFFHIVLHWPMVKSIYKRMIPGKKSRQVLAYMFLFFSILFGIGPLLIQPEVRRAEPNYINSRAMHLLQQAMQKTIC